MNTMNHKGYIARIEFDERDSIFAGRVLGIRTIISFHGETVAELRSEFEAAIEDFLRDCEEQGVRPDNGLFALDATTDVPADFMSEADRNQGVHDRDPFEGSSG